MHVLVRTVLRPDACASPTSRCRHPFSSASRSQRHAAPRTPRVAPATAAPTRGVPRARRPSSPEKETHAARRGSSALDRARHARSTRSAPCARRSSRSAGTMGGGASSRRHRLARTFARACSRRRESGATRAVSSVRSRRARARHPASARGSWPRAAMTSGTWWTRPHLRPRVSPTRGPTRARRTGAAMRRSSEERIGARMNKALAVGWAGIAIAFVAAGGCGSSGSDAPSGDGGAGDAGPRGCPTTFGPNDPPCDQPGLVCPGAPFPCPPFSCCPESIITCGDDGRWRSGMRERTCPNLCPSVFPKAGERCEIPELSCPEPARPCASPCECPRLVATCRNGAWDVADVYVPPPSCRADGGGDASSADASGDADR
jgi:hypothetical protein